MAKHKYISQDAAIDAVDVCNLHRGIIDALQAIISDIPSADVVEVRHGRWEHNDDGYGCENLWWCSACKKEFVLIAGTPCDNGYYYCPNCGADMRGA